VFSQCLLLQRLCLVLEKKGFGSGMKLAWVVAEAWQELGWGVTYFAAEQVCAAPAASSLVSFLCGRDGVQAMAW